MPDRRDLNRSSALQLWVIGAVVPVAFYFIGSSEFRDFDLFWAAAELAMSGQAETIYQGGIQSLLPGGFQGDAAAVFPYPPHALFFYLPFSALPRFPAFLLWDLLTAILFCIAARPYLPKGCPAILAAATPAALICLDFGQNGLLVGALWLLAFRGKWPAVAMLTVKPHLGFLSILSIRRWPVVILVSLLALALIGLSAANFGFATWPAFFNELVGHGGRVGSVKRWLFSGVGPAMAYGFWGWIPFAAAAGLMLARNVNAFTASTASFLISPFAFHYDMTVASLGFGILAFAHWRELPVAHRIPIALGFLSPVIAIGGAWWVPPILLWALWTQVKYPMATRLADGADAAGGN